jgi:hypothetical protein
MERSTRNNVKKILRGLNKKKNFFKFDSIATNTQGLVDYGLSICCLNPGPDKATIKDFFKVEDCLAYIAKQI